MLKQLIQESWQNVHGFKKIAWQCMGFFLLFLMGIGIISIPLDVIARTSIAAAGFRQLLVQGIEIVFMPPLVAGFAMIALKKLRGEVSKVNELFRYFSQPFWLRLVSAFLVNTVVCMMLMVGVMHLASGVQAHPAIGLKVLFSSMILVIVLFYILASTAAILAALLIVDKNHASLHALWMGYKKSFDHIFLILGVIFMTILSSALGLLCLVVGLVWALPFNNLLMSNMYRKLFNA